MTRRRTPETALTAEPPIGAFIDRAEAEIASETFVARIKAYLARHQPDALRRLG